MGQGSGQHVGQGTEREQAFVAAVAGHGLRVPDAYHQDTPNEHRGGEDAFERLMALVRCTIQVGGPLG